MHGLLLLAMASAAASASEPGLRFEANQGQAKATVRYLARSQGATAFFDDSSIRFAGVTLHLAGENRHARWEPDGRLSSTSSYFIGNDPSRWVRDAPHYVRLIRRGAYPGIDAVFYGAGQRMEFDFRVAPQADPSRIRLACPGATLFVGASGELIVESGGSRLVIRKPLLYQGAGAERLPIDGAFRVDAQRAEARFDVGRYNRALPMTIDPVVDSWAFLGGRGEERITAALPGFVAGVTRSTLASSDNTPHGSDIFIWNGQSYSVYGGSGDEEPTAVARLSNGQYIVAGWTSSQDFPAIGSDSAQRVYGGGARDGFFLRQLYQRTVASYFGGSGDDAILAVTVDPGVQALDSSGFFLAGETSSTDFPVRAALQPALAGGKDGFVTRFGASGLPTESTYWGGSGDDAVLAIDANERSCWFGGRTTSPDLRLLNPSQSQPRGGTEGFLARLDESRGATLGYSTYWGGSGDDEVRAVRIGPDGWVWTAGSTSSSDLAVTTPTSYAGGGSDVWTTRLHPGDGSPSFVSYFGGSGSDEVRGIAHDGNGDLYLAGWTTSSDLRTVEALQPGPGGGEDGFLARIDREGAVAMLTYIGGSADDRLSSVSVDFSQMVFAAGQSRSPSIPALSGASAGSTSAAATPTDRTVGLQLLLRRDGIYAKDLVIGRNLSARLNVTVVAGGQTAGVGQEPEGVVVRSSDPDVVQVQGGAFSPFAPFTITAGGVDGEAELIVSSPELPTRRVKVRVRPSYLVNPYESEVVAPLDQQVTVSVRTATVHPESGELIYQTPRSGAPITTRWRSSAPDVVQVHDSSNSYSQTISASIRGAAEGAAAIAVEDPLFPVMGSSEIRVRVTRNPPPVLSLQDTAVGRLMQTRLNIGQMATANARVSPIEVRVTSEDPSKVLLSATPSGVRSESVVVTLENSGDAAGTTVVWAQGRSETGVARVRIEVDGAPAVFGNVAVVRGIIGIAPPAHAINAGISAIEHDLALTGATVALWSTRPLFALYADIPRSPVGFIAGPQIPSSEARNTFGVKSSDPTVTGGASDLSFNLTAGTPYIAFFLRLLKAGTTDLSVSTSEFETAPPLRLTVGGQIVPFSPTEITLGKDLATQVSLYQAYDFPNDVSITVKSSDPSKVLLGTSRLDEGPEITTKGRFCWASALASSGDVPITISAPGYEPRTLMAHLAPTAFRLTPASLTVEQGKQVLVSLTPTVPGSSPLSSVYTVRPAVKPSFSLTTSDASVVRVNTPTITFIGQSANLEAVAVGAGTAELRLSAISDATVDPEGARSTATITPQKIPFSNSQLVLGKDLQTLVLTRERPIRVEGARIRSLDPSRLLLSSDSKSAGQPEVEAANYVWAQALADSGEAYLAITAPGYEEARIRVLLYPTAIGFWSVGRPLRDTVAPGGVLNLEVAPMAVDPASGNPVYIPNASFRGGMEPFEAQIRSSDPAVGRIFSPIAFGGGMSAAPTQFRAEGKGSATLSVDPPAGLVDGGALARREIAVTYPRLSIQDVVLGKDMQLVHSLTPSGPGQSSTAVQITSSDPSKALVSATPERIGQATATITLEASASYGVFYVQALDNSGEVTLTATAGGYEQGAGSIRLEPSYFAFEPGSSWLRRATTLNYRSAGQRAVYLTHPSDSSGSNRSLRPGAGAQEAPIESSDSSVVAVRPPITFPEGRNLIQASLIAGEAGTATLTIGAPPQFALAPERGRTDVVEVRLRSMGLHGGYIGKDRVSSLGVFEPVEWTPLVRLVSSDPSRLLLSLNPEVAGAPEVSFTSDPKKATTLYGHALTDTGVATVSATAAGFQPASLPVSFERSGYRFSVSSITVAAGRTATVKIITADSLPLRPGVAPVGLSIDNSSPAIATSGTVTFGPGDTSKDLTITGKSPGNAVLTIRDSGKSGFSSLIITVTAN
jgi:hypothetical protein